MLDSLIEAMEAENLDLRARLKRINEIAHTPTPAGLRAYTHFQRDFDEIRKLCNLDDRQR